MRLNEAELLSAESLRALLSYDPETGHFAWRVRRQGTGGVGSRAGSRSNRYWSIMLDGRAWKAHRLAWLWVTGQFPASGMQVDHINGLPTDNRFCNLRVVTQAGNMQNLRCTNRETTSRHLGVSLAGKKWAASIRTCGVRRYLGVFDSPDEAHKAYLMAKRTLHPTCTV